MHKPSDYSRNILGSYLFCFKMTKLYWFWLYIEHMLIVEMSQLRENYKEWIVVRKNSVYMAGSIQYVYSCLVFSEHQCKWANPSSDEKPAFTNAGLWNFI